MHTTSISISRRNRTNISTITDIGTIITRYSTIISRSNHRTALDIRDTIIDVPT